MVMLTPMDSVPPGVLYDPDASYVPSLYALVVLLELDPELVLDEMTLAESELIPELVDCDAVCDGEVALSSGFSANAPATSRLVARITVKLMTALLWVLLMGTIVPVYTDKL